jgi:hypothetical protein
VVGGGHHDALVALLIAAGLLVVVRRPVPSIRPATGRSDPETDVDGPGLAWPQILVTALLTVAVLVKVPAAVALVAWMVLVVRAAPVRARARAAALHTLVALGIVAAVSAPFSAGARTLRTFATLTSVEGWASGPRLVARGAEALGRAMTSGTGAGFGKPVYAIFLAAFALAFVRLLASNETTPGHAWGASMMVLALAAPYLLPWYSAWFLPMVPFLLDRRLAAIAIVVSLLLALTGIPAEPSFDPGVWRDMVLAVHYVVAPLMLGLLMAAMAVILRHPSGSAKTGATVTSRLAKARA